VKWLAMKDCYDVLVVGAGPAGSVAAKTAADRGLNVLLIEKKQEIGEPVRCAEGMTDGQGVFRQAVKELRDAEDVRVFASADGHVASNKLPLSGLKPAEALADKGYIYTDRPIYRAGQRVAVRGCIRHVAGEALATEKDKKYSLEVLDSRNRIVRRETVTLGPFGTQVGAVVERLVTASADVEDDPDVDRIARRGRGCPAWAHKQQRGVRHEEHLSIVFHLARFVETRGGQPD
jgi:hypothetical protein